MTPADFKKRLDMLLRVIGGGLQYYTVWATLRFREDGKVLWSLEEQNAVLSRFNGFFVPVASAVFDMALLQFAKVFDTNSRTVSLATLMRAARADPRLVPHISQDQIDQASDALGQSEKLVAELRRRRNQELAHADANPAPPANPILRKEFDELIESITLALDLLSRGHERTAVSWKYLLGEVKVDTINLIEALVLGAHSSDAKGT